jgi:hypothetical protein
MAVDCELRIVLVIAGTREAMKQDLHFKLDKSLGCVQSKSLRGGGGQLDMTAKSLLQEMLRKSRAMRIEVWLAISS